MSSLPNSVEFLVVVHNFVPLFLRLLEELAILLECEVGHDLQINVVARILLVELGKVNRRKLRALLQRLGEAIEDQGM